MAQEWYRNETWSPEIEEAFQARLRRCRTQGPQCLKIQAQTLASTRPEIALKLLDQYFATGDTSFIADAHAAQAEAYMALQHYEYAIRAYRQALAWEAVHPNSLTTSYLELPYLIAALGRHEDFDEALATLRTAGRERVFPFEEFLYETTMALISQARGNREQAISFAKRAIAAAESDRSPFPRHPTLGLVGDSYAGVVSSLRAIAGLTL